MSMLSLRKIPKDVERAIIRESKKRKTTKSEVVIDLLKKALAMNERMQKKQRFKEFFSPIANDELKAIEKGISEFSKIEEEMWRAS